MERPFRSGEQPVRVLKAMVSPSTMRLGDLQIQKGDVHAVLSLPIVLDVHACSWRCRGWACLTDAHLLLPPAAAALPPPQPGAARHGPAGLDRFRKSLCVARRCIQQRVGTPACARAGRCSGGRHRLLALHPSASADYLHCLQRTAAASELSACLPESHRLGKAPAEALRCAKFCA